MSKVVFTVSQDRLKETDNIQNIEKTKNWLRANGIDYSLVNVESQDTVGFMVSKQYKHKVSLIAGDYQQKSIMIVHDDNTIDIVCLKTGELKYNNNEKINVI